MSSNSPEANALHFIQLRGSSTVMKVMQRIGLKYMDENPGIRLPLLGGGTAMGYKSALDGTAEIGMASGQIPQNIQLWSSKHKLAIDEVTIAVDSDNIFSQNNGNPTMHYGVEVRPIRGLALRGGLYDGSKTAGASIGVGGFILDYAYLGGAFNKTQMVGATWKF